MGQFIVFLVIVLAPLGFYLFNAGIAHRGMREVRARVRAAGLGQPPRRPKAAKVTPLRPLAPPRNCGRDLTHALLFLVGARNSCRYCQERRDEPAVPPSPPNVPEAGGVLAEVQRMLDGSKD